MRISSAPTALFAARYLGRAESNMDLALRRLSSGRRINTAADDPAGMSRAVVMATQISGLQIANRNITDAKAVTGTVDATYTTAVDLLQKMRDLVLSSSGLSDQTALQANHDQLTALRDELDALGDNAAHGTVRLFELATHTTEAAIAFDTDVATTRQAAVDQLAVELGVDASEVDLDAMVDPTSGQTLGQMIDGWELGDQLAADTTFEMSGSRTLTFQTGAGVGDTISLKLDSVHARHLGSDVTVDGSGTLGAASSLAGVRLWDAETGQGADATDISDALAVIDGALGETLRTAAHVGAVSNRLDSRASFNTSAVETLTEARSQLVDTDIAAETLRLAQAEIAYQAAGAAFRSAVRMPALLFDAML